MQHKTTKLIHTVVLTSVDSHTVSSPEIPLPSDGFLFDLLEPSTGRGISDYQLEMQYNVYQVLLELDSKFQFKFLANK